MTQNHELENCLTKAISKFKVRDILTKFGIPEDAEVTLEMQIGENSEPIASSLVPIKDKNDHISCASISLKDFPNLLAESFVNPAVETFDLSKLIASAGGSIDNDQNKLIISLKSTAPTFDLDLAIRMGCCRYCGGICCVIKPTCP